MLGMIARGGQCSLKLCSNVRQTTFQPWITKVIQQGSTVNTYEYSIYTRLPAWGYVHVTVNHSEGEYARDADGHGVNEVHVNTMEGLWSLLRSSLRPYRGISQRFLPLCIGFSRAMHNIRQCGHSLLGPLLSLLLTSAP
ncbi:transposase (plasmid) [Deinococcus radiomollis]|uniref:transposase n=1 Tax=Deinococcus radiomollis TaxID=468916 RepID=UPI003891CF7E